MPADNFDIKNIPEDFLARMKSMLGDKYDAFIASYEKPYKSALRLNELKASLDAAKILMTDEGFNLSKVPWSASGFYYDGPARPGKHPYHDAGLYYIQEPSAMIVAELSEVKPGERVLDLCAAPGGKTTALAALMRGEGILVANEIHPGRAKILSENVERMGIRNAFVVSASPDTLSARFEGFFDKIIVDAPCSGEGMFRKEPDAIKCWSRDNIDLCAERQRDILEEAQKMLAPSGTLVYSTCTFAPEEDELQVEAFVKSHPGFSIEQSRKMWPHEVDGEGHFVCVLKRDGDKALRSNHPLLKKSPGVSPDAARLWHEFESSFLKSPLSGTLVSYGDTLYLMPENLDINGLKCLRPGLQLGDVSKGRFTPSHALAIALCADDLSSPEKEIFNLNTQDARRYVGGESLRINSKASGFVLVTVNGISLAFGKISNHLLKNHYPKGLRHN